MLAYNLFDKYRFMILIVSIMVFITLIQHYSQMESVNTFSVMISSASILSMLIFIDMSNKHLRRIKFYRKKAFLQTNMEGVWVTKTTVKERPWSCSQIRYNRITDCWIYEGEAYNENGKVCARWNTKGLQMGDTLNGVNRWMFQGWGCLVEEVDGQMQEGERTSLLEIVRVNKKRPDRLIVHVIDENLKSAKAKRHMSAYGVRLTGEEVKNILGKRSIIKNIFSSLTNLERYDMTKAKKMTIDDLYSRY